MEIAVLGVWYANEAMLKQMTANLVENVSRYTTDGGTVSLETEKSKLILKNSCADINKEQLDKLIEPFVKGDISRSERKGSGLGLSSVQRLAIMQSIRFQISVVDKAFIVSISE